MARKRMVDSDGLLFDARLCKACKALGILCYQRLWAIAEDSGCYEWEPEDILLEMGALQVAEGLTVQRLTDIVHTLVELGKVVPFEAEGRQMHWLKNFHKHQRLRRSPPPKLPTPPWLKVNAREEKGGRVSVDYEVLEGEVPSFTSRPREPRPKKPEPEPAPAEPKARKATEEKKAFGPKQNVYLTQKEHDALVSKHGARDTAGALEFLSWKKDANGYKYKSDYSALHSWALAEYFKGKAAGATPAQVEQRPSVRPVSELVPEDTGPVVSADEHRRRLNALLGGIGSKPRPTSEGNRVEELRRQAEQLRQKGGESSGGE